MDFNKELLRSLIKEIHWTQGELASRIGVTGSAISNVLNGKRRAGRKVILGLMKAFPEQDVKSFFTSSI